MQMLLIHGFSRAVNCSWAHLGERKERSRLSALVLGDASLLSEP